MQNELLSGSQLHRRLPAACPHLPRQPSGASCQLLDLCTSDACCCCCCSTSKRSMLLFQLPPPPLLLLTPVTVSLSLRVPSCARQTTVQGGGRSIWLQPAPHAFVGRSVSIHRPPFQVWLAPCRRLGAVDHFPLLQLFWPRMPCTPTPLAESGATPSLIDRQSRTQQRLLAACAHRARHAA